MRGHDLFVAVGSTIRVLNLTEFKDAWTIVAKEAFEKNVEVSNSWFTLIPYKLLNTPQIDFSIESLTPSINGRLLSVTGAHSLVIVCLPRQGFGDISLSKKEIDCRTLDVGRKYYSKSEILKVDWHPLSESKGHLVVLSSDSILRIFNVGVDIEEPEQSFDLSPVESKSGLKSHRGFSFEDDDMNGYEDAVTFSLGGVSHEQSGWEPFTIHYALRNGHMYALCPVIPFGSAIHKRHLDNLSILVEAKYQKTKNAPLQDTRTLSRLFKLQKQWLQHLIESAKVGRKVSPTSNDTLSVISNTTSFSLPLRRQGPFMINHQHSLLNIAQVTDILYIYTEPIHLLALAFSNGQVENHILTSETDAQWQMPAKNKEEWHKELETLLSHRDFLPTAILYESIDLKAKSSLPSQSMRLVSDPHYPDTYYIYHASGVAAIDMSKWLEAPKQVCRRAEDGKTDTSGDLKRWLSEKTTSDVRHLINTAPLSDAFAPIVGLFVITNFYLSYTLISMTFDYKLVYSDLNIRRDIEPSEKLSRAVKDQLKGITSTENEPAYESILSLPAFEKPKELNNLPKQSKIVIPSELADSKEVVINEETLRFFSKSAEKVRRETRELGKAAVKIKERISLQQKEFEKQVDSVKDIYERYQKYFSPEAKKIQEKVLKDITSRHAKLRLRMDEQLRLVMLSCQPGLSKEENEWIEKLQTLSDKINGTSGYASRIDLLKKQLEQVKNQSKKDKKFNPTNMSDSQRESILNVLKGQNESIDQAKKRIENLERKMQTITL
ncbi:hypothetical protein RO3G_04406 [Rhizopus delemar RA 99-880]|uniref:Uncharacterized protein n=1 Tax=Rhizopus delemar (strain RA 99-880 / ATCC MYA-4621 / FGSC 9543 / NRRL 43880) TaxID=246409 RepID=I1BU21_RHIO9|nr:hypothetical protein RO3G_04406 [Rhizopus delemar RA 99-880]|eukprot:EIE79701.1 hypothetical protein RO3G_04406 [Rhizopus delemar RA 99-880]